MGSNGKAGTDYTRRDAVRWLRDWAVTLAQLRFDSARRDSPESYRVTDARCNAAGDELMRLLGEIRD